MKLQITPIRKVEDALVIWPEPTPDVDIVMDPKTMQMKPGSIKAIYAFDVLGSSGPENVIPTLENFFRMLQPDGELYIIEHDFDYVARAYLGGDLPIDEFNRDFRRGTYLNQNEISALLNKVGFPEGMQKIWHKGIKFPKEHYQIIMSGKKPVTK